MNYLKKLIAIRIKILKNKSTNQHNQLRLNNLLKNFILSKLVCHYCHKKVKLLYQHVRDPEQWTLDRIDNDLPPIQMKIQ